MADLYPVPAAARPEARPHLITSDAEAIAVATAFAEEIRPGASARDAQRRLPWLELDRFVATGLWGITVPKAFGGAGVSAGTLARVTALIAASDGSLAQIPQNHYYSLEILRVGGSEAQKRFFYDRVLAGERTAMLWRRPATATSSAARG